MLEILINDFNIDDATKQLTIAALNHSEKMEVAAQKLGITRRTLNNHIKRYRIKKEDQYTGNTGTIGGLSLG